MRIILDEEEAWSLASLVVAQVLDQVELSVDTAKAIKDWRRQREEGTEPMLALAFGMNEALGNKIDEQTTRAVRRRDYYRKIY